MASHLNRMCVICSSLPGCSPLRHITYILFTCLSNKENNNNLFELAINENPTNWLTNFSYRPITDGDLAISLLIDINEISDEEFYLLMPLELRNEYDKNGVVVFLDWIHENVINQLIKIINS